MPAAGTMHHRQKMAVLDIHPHQHLLRPARAQATTPQFKQAYPTRAVIERIIAWIATRHGQRIKLRYLGTSKNNAWLHNRSAAINLRTLINAAANPAG